MCRQTLAHRCDYRPLGRSAALSGEQMGPQGSGLPPTWQGAHVIPILCSSYVIESIYAKWPSKTIRGNPGVKREKAPFSHHPFERFT